MAGRFGPVVNAGPCRILESCKLPEQSGSLGSIGCCRRVFTLGQWDYDRHGLALNGGDVRPRHSRYARLPLVGQHLFSLHAIKSYNAEQAD